MRKTALAPACRVSHCAPPSRPIAFDLRGWTAVLATLHGRTRAIAPPLRRRLGIEVKTLTAVDTDRSGTFTGEVTRRGSQLDAAGAKIEAAFVAAPGTRVALAREGSFGPHPHVSFAPLGREIVVLSDRETGLELIGHDATLGPRFTHAVFDSPQEALKFARRIALPTQCVDIVYPGRCSFCNP